MKEEQLQGLFLESLSRALRHHSWALAEYQDQMELGANADDLARFKAIVVEPALRECERLRAFTANAYDAAEDEAERLLIDQLQHSHEEWLAASRELTHPQKILFADEYRTLAEKAKALDAKCHAVRLALRQYRKTALLAKKHFG